MRLSEMLKGPEESCNNNQEIEESKIAPPNNSGASHDSLLLAN